MPQSKRNKVPRGHKEKKLFSWFWPLDEKRHNTVPDLYAHLISKFKMAKAKVKCETESGDEECDLWLKTWSNADIEVKEEKPKLPLIKNEFEKINVEEVGNKSLNNRATINLKRSKQGLNTKGRKPRASKAFLTDDSTTTKSNSLISNSAQLSWKEILDNAPVSDTVESLCKYQCPKCSYMCASKNALSKHFKETNHVYLTKGDTKNISKLLLFINVPFARRNSYVIELLFGDT